MAERKIAIIDLGTNIFNLLIVEVEGETSHILHKERYSVGIGKNGINQRKINASAIKRALSAIKSIECLLDKYMVSEVKAVATSAIRNATNGKFLLDEIKNISGIEVNTINGDLEAEYIYYGVRQAFELGNKPVLIMDIGGGSVEFIVANQYVIFWKKSFEIGAQRLFDRFHKHDPVTEKDLKRLNDFLSEQLKPLDKAILNYNPTLLIGSSGTFDTIGEIIKQRNEFKDNFPLAEITIPNAELSKLLLEIIAKNKEDRLKIPGMSGMRVDMMSMSSSLVYYVLNRYPLKYIKQSPFSLKEGLLYSLLNERSVDELSA